MPTGTAKAPARLRRPGLAILLAGLWLLATGPAAGAHALVRSSDPASGSALERSPDAVVITFTEPPDPRISTIQVLDTSGRPLQQGRAEPVPGRPTQLRVAVGDLPDGTYTVSWRTLSRSDGHVTAGAFAFGVGVQPGAVAAPQGAGTPTAPPPSPLGVAGKWAFYWGVALVVGAAAAGLAAFGRRLPGPARPALAVALALAALGLAAMTLAERSDVGVPLRELLATSAGHGLLRQGAGLAVTAAAAALLALRPDRAWRLALAGVAAAGTLVVHVMAGHAAGQSSLRWLALAEQSGHVVAVAAWVGGLVWLLLGLREGGGGLPAAARRFSRLAGIAVAVVVATGALRALDEVGGWGRLLSTSYGRTLDVKLALVAGLLCLGALNRWRLVPAARLGALGRSVRGEVGLAALVLLATGLLTSLPPARYVTAPARPAPPPSVEVSGSDFGTTVRLDLVVTPGTAGPNDFRARVVDYDSGQPFQATRVALSFSLPARPDLGASRLELSRAGDGAWTGKGSPLSIDGRWRVSALVAGAGGAVTVPLQVQTRAAPQQVQVSRVPGQPTVYTIGLAGGRKLQTYIDPGHAGANQVHFTFFDAAGNEQRVVRATASATPPGTAARPLRLLRLGAGHFAANVDLTVGAWAFAIDASLPGGTAASGHFGQAIDAGK
jgi:copper transport protein